MERVIKISEAYEAPYLPLQDLDNSSFNQLGHEQKLNRSLGVLSNFAVSFSIISVLGGLTTTFSTGLTFGGTVTIIYGFPIAGFFTLIVGLAMAEICSAYPTSGGLYYWSGKLSGSEWGPFASWVTGWYASLQLDPTISLQPFQSISC
ncbi:amino-acid permease BAT1-like [Telopea speciosissima]|uniref:amino-acid permease BAT1-like n=1 Tax=Telopea speciosissima TaxID=54955 RepID=UPI001CC49E4C|nr:amino-acid permease BAT1-like [Telopea speciosissima]